MTDDDYTWLDRVQDLGAWILFLGLPAIAIALIGRMVGAW